MIQFLMACLMLSAAAHAVGDACTLFSECQDFPDQCCGTATLYNENDGSVE